MKKYLLPPNGNFYKANLHCHSTYSDGELTPKQIKEIYLKQGYSIVAFTDHDILLSHQHLTDDKFLALNGLELEINESGQRLTNTSKTCHFCLIALKPDNLLQPCYHRSKFLLGVPNLLRDKIKFDNSLADYERVYTSEKISEMMKICRESGFFVTYNHPVWSLEDKDDYLNYHGMHAMEIVNYSSKVAGYPEYNEVQYDQMLSSGKKIYCIAADDNHNHKIGRKCDSFGGYVVIKADNLQYETITNALLSGNFYASEGPEIYDLWVDENRIYIKTSKADSIRLNTGIRRSDICYSEDGEDLTYASFSYNSSDVYFRITVTDKNGNHANTQAYFIEDLV